MFQNKWFYLFCISMLPIVELRGGIPAGAAMGLSFWPVYLTCVLGNLLPVPFLILFAKKILEFLSTLPRIGGFFQKIIRRADQKAAEIGQYEKWGLFLFVAIPLPGTGAWTGSLVAADAYLAGIPGHHGRGTGQRIHHRRDRLRAVHRTGIIQ